MNLTPKTLNKKKFWNLKDVTSPVKKSFKDDTNTVCSIFTFKHSFLLKVKKKERKKYQYVIPLRYTKNENIDFNFYTCISKKKLIIVYEDEIVESIANETKQNL